MTNNFTEDTNKFFSLMVQANQHRQMREFHEAISIYYELIEELGETSEIDQIIADCYFQIGLYERDEEGFREAVMWIKKAIDLAPMSSNLYYLLGQFHSFGTLDYEAAIQAYRTAIDLNSSDVHALVSGAFLYGVPENVITLDEAITWLERAAKIEPHNPNIHFNLGIQYKEAGLLPEAEQEWVKALSCPKPLDASASKTINNLLGSEKT